MVSLAGFWEEVRMYAEQAALLRRLTDAGSQPWGRVFASVPPPMVSERAMWCQFCGRSVALRALWPSSTAALKCSCGGASVMPICWRVVSPRAVWPAVPLMLRHRDAIGDSEALA